jgi:ABC-type transporter Mla subunit MlaD
MVAEQQIKNLHDHQFSNQQLAALLQTAEQRNQEVARYNKGLEREIAGLKKQSKAVRGQVVSAKLKEARQKREYVQGVIADRTDLAAKLSAPQRVQYEKTLKVLQRDAKRLDSSVKRLETMEAGVVGGAKSTAVPRPATHQLRAAQDVSCAPRALAQSKATRCWSIATC